MFGLKVRPEFSMRTMEHLRIYLAETFRARLSESGYFSSVSILPEDSKESTDFTMIGAFTQASIGTNEFNLYNILTKEVFDKSSMVSVVGGILRAREAELVTTFQCQLGCCQSQIRPGASVRKLYTGVGKSEKSISQMAEELKNVYQRKEKARAAVGQK